MTQNKLGNLSDHLFAQMERLSDEDITGDQLKEEIDRAAAITKVSEQILGTGNLVLRSKIAYDENLQRDAKKPEMLEG